MRGERGRIAFKNFILGNLIFLHGTFFFITEDRVFGAAKFVVLQSLTEAFRFRYIHIVVLSVRLYTFSDPFPNETFQHIFYQNYYETYCFASFKFSYIALIHFGIGIE